MIVVFIHLTIAAVCAFECVRALADPRGKLPKLIMFAGLGVIHGLVPALTPRDMTWPGAAEASVVKGALLALVGVVMFSVGWRIYERRRVPWRGPSPGLQAVIDSASGQRFLRRMFWLCGTAGAAAWLLSFVVAAGSIGAALEAGRFEFRGAGHVYWRVMLMHVAALLAVPGFVCFFLPRTYRWTGIAFTLVAAVFLFWATQGARGVALGLVGSLIVGYGLRYNPRPHRIAVLGLAGAAVLALAVSLYEVRKTMARADFAEMARIIVSPDTYRAALTTDPLNYHQFLVAAVEHFPKDHPYLYGATYRRLLVFFLPRQYFESIKPADTHHTFSEAIQGMFSTTTIPPTMMGDGYINFWGAPGVVAVMLFNGVLFAFAAQKLRENLLLFIVIGASFVRFALLGIRGSPYEILTLALSSTLFVWLLGAGSGLSYRDAGRTIRRINADAARTGAIGATSTRPARSRVPALGNRPRPVPGSP